MRLTRMVIEAGKHTIALDLHPELTVITGLGPLERESLAGELIGALGPSRPGVHLEVRTDDDRHLAVFRPLQGRARLVDVDTATDITPTAADGGLDIYAQHGLDLGQARRALKVDRAGLTTQARADTVIQHLAQIDQTELWATATRVRVTDEALQAESVAAGAAPEDAEIIDRIERRHQQLEAALENLNRARLVARAFTFIGVVGAAPASFVNPVLALPCLLVALVSLLATFWSRNRVNRAERAEREALEAAGAGSYLGFHVQRVDGLVSTEQARRRLLAAADDHRVAVAQWTELVGDVSVDWAMENHADITVAAQLQADVRSLGVLSSSAPGDHDLAANLAHALLGRLARARSLGALDECFPLVVDEPFTGLDPGLKAPMLEVLARAAGRPQVILLTDDEDVASWARLEALTGSLAVLEPTPETEPVATSARRAG